MYLDVLSDARPVEAEVISCEADSQDDGRACSGLSHPAITRRGAFNLGCGGDSCQVLGGRAGRRVGSRKGRWEFFSCLFKMMCS